MKLVEYRVKPNLKLCYIEIGLSSDLKCEKINKGC